MWMPGNDQFFAKQFTMIQDYREPTLVRKQVSGKHPSKILVIDLGGSQVKILATGQTERRQAESGETMSPLQMVEVVKELAAGWESRRSRLATPARLARKGRAQTMTAWPPDGSASISQLPLACRSR